MNQRLLPLVFVCLALLPGCEEDQTIQPGQQAPPTRGAVAVVKGTRTAEAFPAEAGSVDQCHARVGVCLDEAGLPWNSLTDEEVEAGKLAGYRLAVFPYNARITDSGVEATQRFVDAGGKLIWFYALDKRLAPLLGLTTGQLTKAAYEGELSRIRFYESAPEGVPRSIEQNSWHALDATPADGTTIIARWADARGQATGRTAATLNANGVWFGHVLLGADLPLKAQMLLALLGHFEPRLWTVAAESAVSRACRVSSIESFDELRARVEDAKGVATHHADAERELRAAQAIRDRALRLAEDRQLPQAVAEARNARGHALRAFELIQPSRPHEFRGVWIHSAYGVSDWGWRKSIRVLAENGFNAVLPNMCWAGKADYLSDILPVLRKTRERGDQLADCVRWARHYGIEVHVWKICYNLSTAPNAFIAPLRKEGRLQRGRNGRELRQTWLCPSNQKNIDLERDSLMEVVRKYRVAGLHLDYIRYPSSAGCYCENCRRLFETRIGRPVGNWPDALDVAPLHDEWQQFRRDQITRLVRAVRKALDRANSTAKLSAAVYGAWEPAREGIAQDAKAWVDEGLLDFLCPMNYTDSLDFQEKLTRQQREAVYGRVPLYPGIGFYSAQSKFTSTDQLIDQIQSVRRLGADGFVVFQYRRDFGEDYLPALARGVTAEPALAPHNAPKFGFQLNGKSPAFELPTVRAGSPVTARITPPQQQSAGEVQVSSARLCHLDDTPVADLTPQFDQGGSSVLSLTPAEGRYRFVVDGMHARGSSPEPFRWRSPIVHVAHHAVVEAQEWKNQPPPEGKGLRVGLYQEGYGSTGLFTCLRRQEQILPFYLRDLSPEMLKQCRVVILAQPRHPTDLTEETTARLRQWVERGGGLLLTHDACGHRDCPNPFPDLWAVAERVEDRGLSTRGPYAALAGTEPPAEFSHSYYDHLALRSLAKDVEVLIADSEGRCVVVACEVSKGRVIASGLALGLAADDEDVEPEGEEAALVRGCVRWLRGT